MKLSQILLGVVGVLVLAFAGYRIANFAGQSGSPTVDYPYWCENGHVYGRNDVQSAGWEIHPEGTSDSVVVCIEEGCEEKAFPAKECQCGTSYLLHRAPGSACPCCNEDVAQRVEEMGIELMPPELPQGNRQCPGCEGEECTNYCNQSLKEPPPA